MKTMLLFQEAADNSLAYPADAIQSINVGANAIVITFLTATTGEDVLTLTTSGDEWEGLKKLCQAIASANMAKGSKIVIGGYDLKNYAKKGENVTWTPLKSNNYGAGKYAYWMVELTTFSVKSNLK